MESATFLAAACTLGLVLGLMVFFPALFGGKKNERTKSAIAKLAEESGGGREDSSAAALRDDSLSDNPMVDALLRTIPGMQKIHEQLKKTGLNINPLMYLVGVGIVFFILKAFTSFMGLGFMGIIISAVGAYIIGKNFIKAKIAARSENFVNMFPDAVDMVVRSVRSGHPFTAAIHMIADNMEAPVSTEFRQVVDEVAYGRTMADALNRMSERVGEADVRFFVVVINVQQETGGNLGEVLSNLSGILRKRKQMRLKIKALTSEGRMTAYILGALPVVVIGVLQLVSPHYLVPLFEHQVGRFILGLAVVMVMTAFLIVKRMIRIDI